MMRELPIGAIFALTACSDPSAPPAPAPKPGAHARFVSVMEAIQVQFDGLNQETQRAAGVDSYRKRTARMTTLAREAMGIPIKKDASHQEQLNAQFRTFLQSLDSLSKSEWSEPAAGVRALESACNSCHQKFQKAD